MFDYSNINASNVNELPETIKTILWFFGAMNELKDRGLVKIKSNTEITDKGISLFDQLDKAWKPSDEMLASYCRYKKLDKDLVVLLLAFRDDRELLDDIVNDIDAEIEKMKRLRNPENN